MRTINYIRFLFSLLLFIIGSQLLTIFTFLPLPLNRKREKRLRELILMHFARFVNFISFNIKITKFNETKESFKIPSIIISNHISMIDISLIIGLTPRLVIISNPEMMNSRYGWLLKKYANVHAISEDINSSFNYLNQKLREGYSILIFPEGVRSPYKIKRFHKGAFMIAEKFKIDILPVLIKAEGHFLNNNSFFRYRGNIQLYILERIAPDNINFGNNYEERTKMICQYYRNKNIELS